MTFILTVELGNDAMRTHGDVANAIVASLSRAAVRSGKHDMVKHEEGTVLDVNGNSVGHWDVEP